MTDLNILKKKYNQYRQEALNLDMTRGKPSAEQLDLSVDLISVLGKSDFYNQSGFDCRNYSTPGLLSGLDESKEIFAKALNVKDINNIIIGGNSSLALMHDTISWAMLHKLPGSKKSWSEQGPIKFLTPVPGYDRHFGICESLGIEMINIPLLGDGPDMGLIEKLVKDDNSIKGIWCVPKYSNPTGETYSDETVCRLANLDTKANDFRVFWDNAYAVHDLHGNSDSLVDIFSLAGEEFKDCIFEYASTSKITFAGAGISAVVSSENNIEWFLNIMKYKTIGYDKINQLRHVEFFKNHRSLEKQMQEHSDLLSPKFKKVAEILTDILGDDETYASWSNPKGGYFIDFNTKPGLAKKVVKMSSEAGVKLTKAGATFPYGIDPEDKNIRIAPSLPSLADIQKAVEILAVVTKIVTLEN
ncbi:MAG: DNA-binding transcriptional MocR family regulator [Francisellaceae bacterium]|jgi:DNA-binding transcriptional MocR family regulator